MENEVIIHVKSEDETERGFASARRGAKKLGDDIERELKASGRKAGRGLAGGIDDGLTAGAPGIIKKADSIGDAVEREMDRAGKASGRKLSDGIGDGMGKAGSGGGGIGAKLASTLGKAGKDGGESFVSSFGSVLGDLGKNPYVMGGIAAAGAALAPVIGGAMAAGVIGIGGGLGIVGGFAAAAMDPRVKGASIALKDILEDDLKAASRAFVPAAVDAIDEVRAAWKSILPDITSIFTQSAGLMDPLLDGMLQGVVDLVDGIEESLGGAGPVFDSLGDMFEEVFSALGDVFAGLSDNGPEAAAALDFLTGALVAAVDAFWIFMEASLAVVDAFRPLGGIIADGANVIDGWIDAIAGGTEAGGEFEGAQEGVADATSAATDATDKQISALRELEETMRKQADPLFAVFDLQTKVRKAQEAYNTSLADNGPHAAKTKKALLDMGKASFELTSALTDAATQGFNGKLTPAMRNALRNAGNTAAQINALEGELIQAWRAANKWSGTYTQTYITNYKSFGLKSPSAMGGFQGLATGGIKGAANGSTSSGMTMVGEHGPELVDLPAGTQVHSNPDTQRMMGGGGGSLAGGGGGKLEVVLRFDASHAPEAIRGVMEGIRAEVRDGGGSVQTVLGVG